MDQKKNEESVMSESLVRAVSGMGFSCLSRKQGRYHTWGPLDGVIQRWLDMLEGSGEVGQGR